jgi:hypothetical protein
LPNASRATIEKCAVSPGAALTSPSPLAVHACADAAEGATMTTKGEP